MTSFLTWLMPNGIGTRAVLAFIVVTATMWALLAHGMVAEAVELATVIILFYFVQRQNGGTKPTT